MAFLWFFYGFLWFLPFFSLGFCSGHRNGGFALSSACGEPLGQVAARTSLELGGASLLFGSFGALWSKKTSFWQRNFGGVSGSRR